jgi:hypothetical protein
MASDVAPVNQRPVPNQLKNGAKNWLTQPKPVITLVA